MRILIVSNNFPPESNAPANRAYDHARQWVEDGHDVTVITDAPNFPEGVLHEGYRNRYAEEDLDGISIRRVPMLISPNEGVVIRIISYISFMLSAMWYAQKLQEKPDVLVASSPQFFTAIAGDFISRVLGCRFVLEIRDLWPASIVAVGAMSRNLVIRLLEKLEYFLYQRADHIVVVTDSFREIMTANGIPEDKITVVKNGIRRELFDGHALDQRRLARLREELGLTDRFVASYVGTLGMAHGASVFVEAAQGTSDPEVLYVLAGSGAESNSLRAKCEELGIQNLRFLGKRPRDEVPYLLAASDVSLVHLRRSPVFEAVLPSKIFEAMAMGRPIVLGVAGEAAELVAAAGAGVAVTPDDAEELRAAVQALKDAPDLRREMAEAGRAYVAQHHCRRSLARRYSALLEKLASEPGRLRQLAS